MKKSDVCAVITTFCPEDSIIENLSLVLKQVGFVVIVNDSGKEFGILSQINSDSVVVINNPNNVGIARSLNLGVDYADCLGFDFILTLDDDSLLDANYVEKLYDFFSENHTCLACGVYDSGKNYSVPFKKKQVVITSGSLFKVHDYKMIDGFSEAMFIDYVDFDFCLRLANKTKLDIFEVYTAKFNHQIGESSNVDEGKFLKLSSFDHSPFRIYYQTRNLFFMVKKFILSNPIFSLYIARNLVLLPLKIILVDTNKNEKIKFFLKGFRDGLLGRMGRLNNE
ncbi:glycosyltransferase [Vibrio cyclitrophicus]|uniref:glycosyltransferase n=1 Tax=Vibrio cyclitrophicus TaxID=47951 RepID=UPI000C84AB75|nr:glycosyltransferase [Vibrio cyclitrophicus]PME75370.1 hypothetical protein BCV29_18655 [Vibrio cyclitrophicus]